MLFRPMRPQMMASVACATMTHHFPCLPSPLCSIILCSNKNSDKQSPSTIEGGSRADGTLLPCGVVGCGQKHHGGISSKVGNFVMWSTGWQLRNSKEKLRTPFCACQDKACGLELIADELGCKGGGGMVLLLSSASCSLRMMWTLPTQQLSRACL